jgi:hypothetical protein
MKGYANQYARAKVVGYFTAMQNINGTVQCLSINHNINQNIRPSQDLNGE